MTDQIKALIEAKRIRVVGISGGGKSRLCRALAEILDLPVIHMDVEFWQPGWVEPDKALWHRKISELVEQDRWIMDGNFSGSMDLTIPPADAIIHLSCSTPVALWGAISRRFKADWQTRSDLAEGCPEQIDPNFMKYIWQFNRMSLPKVEARIAEFGADKPLITLKGRRAAAQFIAELRSAAD